MKWNNNFNMKKNVNGKNITVGMQNFDDMTILVKEETGKIIKRPMSFDYNGNCYFIYDSKEYYLM